MQPIEVPWLRPEIAIVETFDEKHEAPEGSSFQGVDSFSFQPIQVIF
jgi:hypothetical protein